MADGVCAEDACVYVITRTLSVSIVATSSSACTVSPGCFSHVFSVPSEIDSAIWGTFTVSAVRYARVSISHNNKTKQ